MANDLTGYYNNRAVLEPGDVIVFWGAGLNPLSHLIEIFSGGGPSHSAIVRQPLIGGVDPTVVEATIQGSQNGVQTHPLIDVLTGYADGSSAAALLLNRQVRSRLDLKKFYSTVGAADGINHYDVAGLFKFLLPGMLDRHENDKSFVCSAWCTALLEKSGAISNINWSKMSPQSLVEMNIYESWVPLMGKPRLKNFNLI